MFQEYVIFQLKHDNLIFIIGNRLADMYKTMTKGETPPPPQKKKKNTHTQKQKQQKEKATTTGATCTMYVNNINRVETTTIYWCALI